MPTVRELIEQGVALCREHGVEPNRIRLGLDALKALDEETGYSLPGEFARPDSSWLDGFAVEYQPDAPPDAIYIDRKPEDE